MNKTGEYAIRGDYHIEHRKDWKYLPVYVEKMRVARAFLDTCSPSATIYDMGCGEGVLVDDYRARGYNINGIDANYLSEHVVMGNLLTSNICTSSVDALLCLDVIEHMEFYDQENALYEFARVMKPGGRLLISVPNLAHLASRISFFSTGHLLRTSTIERHPGDRPMCEYIALFKKYFTIKACTGLFPTFPLLSVLTVLMPARVVPLHRLYNIFAVPAISFLNIFEMEK